MSKRKFYGPTHRFAMLMKVETFDKLCAMAKNESLAAYVDRLIEREHDRRLRRADNVVPHRTNYVQ